MYAGKLNTDEYQKTAKKIGTVVIPVGSTEAHGRHCPLDTDNIIPEQLLKDVDREMEKEILVAPAVNYGYTPNLAAFPGTVTLKMETLVALYTEVAAGYVKWGARHVVFMNGHGGNVPALSAACDNVAALGAYAMVISYWLNFSKDILTVCSGQGHAGEDETSLVLALEPSLVDMDKAAVWEKKPLIAPMNGPDINSYRFPDAVTGDARKATRDKGEELFRLLKDRNVAMIRAFAAGEYAK